MYYKPETNTILCKSTILKIFRKILKSRLDITKCLWFELLECVSRVRGDSHRVQGQRWDLVRRVLGLDSDRPFSNFCVSFAGVMRPPSHNQKCVTTTENRLSSFVSG